MNEKDRINLKTKRKKKKNDKYSFYLASERY